MLTVAHIDMKILQAIAAGTPLVNQKSGCLFLCGLSGSLPFGVQGLQCKKTRLPYSAKMQLPGAWRPGTLQGSVVASEKSGLRTALLEYGLIVKDVIPLLKYAPYIYTYTYIYLYTYMYLQMCICIYIFSSITPHVFCRCRHSR